MRGKRISLLIVPFVTLLLLGSYYLGKESLSALPHPKNLLKPFTKGQSAKLEPPKDGVILSSGNLTEYIDAIFDKSPSNLPRAQCPALDVDRYKSLKVSSHSFSKEIKYFFALDLRNCVALLPRLIGSIVEAIEFLGADSCALSIVEGDSPDGTGEVLEAIRPRLEAMGATYIFDSSTVHSGDGDRIAKLAKLRNMPLQPVLKKHKSISEDTTIIFLNDVAACPEDILELVFQRKALNADMTCAMDWTHDGGEPAFYDVWIARGMNGDSFFHIPADGSWAGAWDLFWNAPDTKSRLDNMRPFQVFACWNGAVAFTAKPLLEGLRFRTNNHTGGECFQGEPVLFCKDMWWRGYGKIAVIPSVNLEYDNVKGEKIKKEKGFTSDLVAKQDLAGDLIDWQLTPPDEIRCMPTWNGQFMERWNKSLTP